MSRVELRQLVYFEAVVRHGGFTRAAEQLRIAQPAVSAQIRRLERELGTPLLQRTTRRLALTHAGELFLVRARRALAEVEGARSDLDELSGVLRGQLRIGATALLGPLNLPAAMAECRRRFPGLRLTLHSGLIGPLLAALEGDRLDVVVGPIHADLPARLQAKRLVKERLVLVLPPGRQDRHEALRGYAEEPFTCLPPGSGLHAILTEAAAAEGFTPRVEFEADTPQDVRALVSAGLGVALLAESLARAPGPPVEVVELRRAPKHPPLGVIRRRGQGPTLEPQRVLERALTLRS
jgi:LysR family transcriptional activator of glutamate synthase operon